MKPHRRQRHDAKSVPQATAPSVEARAVLIWNVIGFGVASVAAVLLQFSIGRFLGAPAVGIFNEALAVLFVAAHFGTLGAHYSALRYLSEVGASASVFWSALLLNVSAALPTSVFVYLLGPVWEILFDSPTAGVAVQSIAVGLFFHCLNKTLLGAFNGLERMRTFALGQALRYPLWALGFLFVPLNADNLGQLPLAVSIGEVALFLVLCLMLTPLWRSLNPVQMTLSDMPGWFRRHLLFGSQSFLSGSLIELNTRVDILVIGYFQSDAVTGVYALGSMLYEGMTQLSVVLRNQVGPILTRSLLGGNHTQSAAWMRGEIVRFYQYLVPVSLLSIVAYPIAVQVLAPGQGFDEGWSSFAVLCLGFALCAGYLPFNMIFLQGDKPWQQTVFQVFGAAVNLVLNVLLVPPLGIVGAALGTSLSLLASTFYLKHRARAFWKLTV